MKKGLIVITVFIFICLLGIPLWVVDSRLKMPAETGDETLKVRVLNNKTGKIIGLPLEEYLVGVVAAEMPGNFELEALKVQAVAARTYTVRRMFNYGAKPCPGHPHAEVCTDPVHCQAWEDEKKLKEKWGSVRYYIYINKIRTAVNMTKGQVITYRNSVIDPVYYGSCGGKGTENSEDVWSYEIPYLRSVNCDTEYRAAEQAYTIEVDQLRLLSLLRNSGLEPVPAMAEGQRFIQPVKRSARGRLQEVKVFGQRVTGTALRQGLGLTSTLISWESSGGKLKFTSTGKGHAVGLCQYGANGMALAGHDYKTIISHYYTGVQIQKLQD